MSSIIQVFLFFLLSLFLGTYAFVPVFNIKETGAGLVKLFASVAGSALLFYVAIRGYYLNFPYELIPALLAFIYVYLKQKDSRSAIDWGVYFLIILPSSYHFISLFLGSTSNFLFALSSMFYFGTVTFAMILGHWYLVTPRLSTRPLKILSFLMWAIMIPKIIWSIWFSLGHPDLFEQYSTVAGGYSFNWVMLTMRFLWGYLVIGVMSIFNWKLIKLRSIQSATGILYAMTFFVFIGEMVSMYLFFKYGLFI